MLNDTTVSATNSSPGPSQQPSRPTPMLPIRQLGARSSLLSHTFPSFYACYLLKSIQTPQSTAVYIGSTPSPPRRIRQHNGELTQGARKTQSKRPWVMQMIVHGFPSRLAALQFEWAWQHPHRSRHLRDTNGSLFGSQRSRLMKKNIAIVRAMISRHPFSTWPLHVKLFTAEAVQYWNASARIPQVLPLPPGFTCSVELEGVDGKSGHPGSGRQGPIIADDEEFTTALLAKNNALIASEQPLECSVCHKPLHSHIHDPLSTALCPSKGCLATSHLACLGEWFLKEETESKNLIPRGGSCPSCGTYTLWGDIVRGCYRRLPPAERNGPQYPDIASDDMFVTDEDDIIELSEATPKRRSKFPTTPRRSTTRSRRSRKQKDALKSTESSEGESFDFDNIASSSESDAVTPIKRKPGRPRLVEKSPTTAKLLPETTPKACKKKIPSPSKICSSTKTTGKAKTQVLNLSARNGESESFSLSNIASSSDSNSGFPVKRSPGGPRKIVAFAPDVPSPSLSSTKIGQTSSSKIDNIGKEKKKARRTKSTSASTSTSSSEGEIFDFTSVASSSGSDDAAPPKRKAGRPRKNSPSLPDIRSSFVKHQTHLPLHAHDIPSPGRLYTTTNSSLKLHAEPIYADSSSDIEILHHLRGTDYYSNNTSAGKTLSYHTPKNVTPARHSSSSHTSPDSWLDKTLALAMTTLSVSTPSRAPVNSNKTKDKRGEDIEVIVLSD